MDLEEYFDSFARRDWQETPAGDGTVGLALVGLGWWTREEAIPAIRDAGLCEATVAVSGDREKAERVAEVEGTVEAGITYGEFHEGAAADAYDAVYVCTPNARHREYVETAADLGKAVLCEKPVEASRERAEGEIRAARPQ